VIWFIDTFLYNHNQLTVIINDCLRLAPFSFLFSFSNRPLICDWTTYIVVRWTHKKDAFAWQWIYTNHIENTASSVVVFTARCIVMEAIRLLPAYLLSRIVCFTWQQAFSPESVSSGTCLPSHCPATGVRCGTKWMIDGLDWIIGLKTAKVIPPRH
jgi:hypothetical protein